MRLKNLFFTFGFMLFVICSAGTANAQQDQMMGGEFALTFGGQSGPFDIGTGWFMSGELGIPLMTNETGKVMGLINISLSKMKGLTIFIIDLNYYRMIWDKVCNLSFNKSPR